VPDGQLEQVVLEIAPEAVEKVPAPQRVQTVDDKAPSAELYVPAPQVPVIPSEELAQKLPMGQV
jgi:hypothetical protein